MFSYPTILQSAQQRHVFMTLLSLGRLYTPTLAYWNAIYKPMREVTQPYDMKDYISVKPGFEWEGNVSL